MRASTASVTSIAFSPGFFEIAIVTAGEVPAKLDAARTAPRARCRS